MIRAATALLAATALVGTAGQAQAQDGQVLPPPPPPGMVYQQPAFPPAPPMAPPAAAPGYEAQAYAAPGYPVQAFPDPAYAAPVPYEAQGPAYGGYARGLPPVASVGYTREERDSWLKDCRLAYEGAIKKDTAIIGGIVGAIGGGFIGRHETHGSNLRRVGGTLIGAGVGGLVGLALGALVGGAFEKKKRDQCEGYLERYQGGGYLPGPEAGFGYGWQRNVNWGQYGYGNYGYGNYGYGYGGYTTVMVPVQVGGGYTYGAPIRTESRYVVEDVVEEVVTVPARTKYVRQAPTKYVKDKRVRYAK